jgi:hypothetical protein
MWDAHFNPNSVLDIETIQELQDSYIGLTGSVEAPLSLDVFSQWQDVQDMVAAQELSNEELLLLWGEAVATSSFDTINYEQFLRLNIRLEVYLMAAEDGVIDSATGGKLRPIHNYCALFSVRYVLLFCD